MFKKIGILLIILGSSLPLTAFESQLSISDELDWLSAESIRNRSSELSREIKEVAANVTLISAQEIDDMGANTLFDILRVVPGLGLTVSELGDTVLESRGIRLLTGNKVLLSINGYPINVISFLSNSILTFGEMSVSHIHSVEIIKGPTSVLYGGAGYHLIVNVITKSAEEVSGVDVYGGTGSFNAKRYGVLTGFSVLGFDVLTNYSYLESDRSGFSTELGIFDLFSGRGALVDPGGTVDGHNVFVSAENDLFQLQAGYLLRNRKNGFGLGSFFGQEFPSITFERNDDLLMFQGKTHIPLSSWVTIVPSAYMIKSGNNVALLMSSDEGDEFTEIFIENSLFGGDLQFELIPLNPIKSIFGVKYERGVSPGPHRAHDNTLDPSFNYEIDSEQEIVREVIGFYNETIFDLTSWFRLFSGVRYEDYNQGDANFSYQLGSVWQPFKGYSLKIAYGNGNRNPEFADIINLSSSLSDSNEVLSALRHEQIENLEIANTLEIDDSLSVFATYFLNNYEDLLEVDTDTGQFQNALTGSVQGIEFGIHKKLKRGTYFEFNAAYLESTPFKGIIRNDIEEVSSINDLGLGGVIPNVPQFRTKAILNIQFNRHLNFFNELHYQSEIVRVEGDVRDNINGFYVWNSSAILQNILDGFDIKTSILNVLDEEIIYPSAAFDVRGLGRSYSVEISKKF